jgi:hypothetical protein
MLSSCKWERWSLFTPAERWVRWACFLSPPFKSLELRAGFGKLVEDEDGECFRREPSEENTNLGSIASRFFGCGGRLFAAYGSFTSPAGVNGMPYPAGAAAADLLGLASREVGTERPGPTEKGLRRFELSAPDSADRLVSLVESWPAEPGLEVETLVADVGDVRKTSAEESISAPTFPSKGSFVLCPMGASRDPEAAGVRGGECIVEDLGLIRGEGRPEDEWVRCRLASRETFSSFEGTYTIEDQWPV